jgi:hypothetical protein
VKPKFVQSKIRMILQNSKLLTTLRSYFFGQTRQLHTAVTVIVAYTVLGWFGCPALYDVLALLANVPGLESIIPALHPVLSGLVIAAVAGTAPGVYRAMLANDAKDRQMLTRSLTITGRLP